MEFYKLASKQKLRFQTSKGNLSVEQLWELSEAELDALAVSLEDEYNQSGKKSFLVKRSVKDKTTKMKFDIVLDILNTKVEERQSAEERAEKRAKNKKIIELIAEKQDESLKGKSIKQLEAMLVDED
jgi:uncharacterized membrane protein